MGVTPYPDAGAIADAARSADANARASSARRAGNLEKEEAAGFPRLAELLTGLLADPAPEVVYAALEAITSLAYREALHFGREVRDALIQTARHAEEVIRAESAVALAVLPPDPEPATTRVLLDLLSDPSPKVRREAAAGLGDVGAKDAAAALARVLEDSDDETRFEAAFALASMGDSRGVATLIDALGSTRHRFDACEALRRLGPNGGSAAAPVVRRHAKSFFVGWSERLTLWATLYALGDVEAAHGVISRTRAWNRQERSLALALIGTHKIREGSEVLTAVARAPKDPLQGTAVRALGDLSDASSAPTLLAVAEDEATPLDVRIDAVQAIGRLPGDERGRAIEKLVRSNTPDVARTARALRAA